MLLFVTLVVVLVLVARANAASADDAVELDPRADRDALDTPAGPVGSAAAPGQASPADGSADEVALAEARQLADALTGIELDDRRDAWRLAFGDLELDDAERTTSILDVRVPEASSGALGDALTVGALERSEASARRSPMHWGHLDLDVAWRQSWRAPLRSSAYRSSELWLLATWRR